MQLNILANFLFLLLITNCLRVDANEGNEDLSWPKEIETEIGFIITLYQPQLESFESDILEGRMALTIESDTEEIVFGALWFKARLLTDFDNRTAILEEMDIVKTHFPGDLNEEDVKRFSELLSARIESWNLEMSLDRILASLDEVENLKQLSDNINNDPPTIYYRNTPAVLISIDGEPILQKNNETELEYVVNTPFFIVTEKGSNDYYLNGGPFWYTSKEILSGWKETEKIPASIKSFAEKNLEETEPDTAVQSYTKAPELIIETKPAELILVDGATDYKPIDQTTLLYVSNSESDIIMDINSQNHYILIAGRWYYSKTLKDGDWKFCEPKDLPEDFKKIPEDSDMANVRASIPGTPEAEEAVLEQSIPQTATIDRKEAKVEVTYDGDPKFEKIEGTDISYALNTDKTVLLINSKYYCIDNAVWFVSKKATGPWEVSAERPEEVDDIPPEAPVYNVKYTYIYHSTPEVVYVGYLPGYTYSYVYGGVVVYGTGYYYHPWYAAYYYPRPVTWGYGVHYNPYSGWRFTVGVSYGWVSWGYHPYHRCYWGPRGYHRGYRHGYHRGYHHGYSRGYRAGYAAGKHSSNRNVYANRSSGVRKTVNPQNVQRTNNVNKNARPSNKANNMYTDRNGNVYQRNQSGNYDNKTNRPASGQRPSTGQQPSTRPSTGQKPSTGQQPSSRPSTGQKPSTGQQPSTRQQPSTGQQPRQPQSNPQLDRSYQNRQQGNQNYNRSQQQRSSAGTRAPSGTAGRRR